MSETERDPRLCGRLERAFDRSTGMPPGIAVVLVGLGLAGAWTATYLAGGSQTVLPHAFYLAIIVAAGRFSWPGAVLGGGVAGLIAGPLMPLDVDAGTAQLAVAWWGRMMAFLLVGLLVAWLTSRSRGSIVGRVRDARSAGELRQALRKGQFELHYQPLVDLESREILGFEALCRRRDPIAGLVGRRLHPRRRTNRGDHPNRRVRPPPGGPSGRCVEPRRTHIRSGRQRLRTSAG